MVEADLKQARSTYLFSCGLALTAALAGIAGSALPQAGAERTHGELIFVGLAALALFAWIATRIWRSSADSRVPELSSSTRRLRKMSWLWLGLAAAIGISIVRPLASALLAGSTSELSLVHWLLAVGGLLIILAAVWRFATSLRRGARDG
jgi:hypothetical protein